MTWWAWVFLAASMIRGRSKLGSPRPMLADAVSLKVRSGLEDGGDLGAERVERHLAEVAAVHPDPARLRVEQPGQEADQGLLAVLVSAHQGGLGAGGDLQRDPFQEPPAGRPLDPRTFSSTIRSESGGRNFASGTWSSSGRRSRNPATAAEALAARRRSRSIRPQQSIG